LRTGGKSEEANVAEKNANEEREHATKSREQYQTPKEVAKQPETTGGTPKEEPTPQTTETAQTSAERLTEGQLQRRQHLTAERNTRFAMKQELEAPLKKAKLEYDQAKKSYYDLQDEFNTLEKRVKQGDPKIDAFYKKRDKLFKRANKAES
jgi:chromosome segregation ATPase